MVAFCCERWEMRLMSTWTSVALVDARANARRKAIVVRREEERSLSMSRSGDLGTGTEGKWEDFGE